MCYNCSPIKERNALSKEEVIMLNEAADCSNEYRRKIAGLARSLQISKEWATDIFFFRSHSSWTEKLEDELIKMAKENKPRININDWIKK